MRCRNRKIQIWKFRNHFWVKWTDSTDQKSGKKRVYLPLEELLDGAERMPSSPISHALTWRRKTPTAAAEKTRSAASMRTASKRSRQLSASSPAMMEASDGARV